METLKILVCYWIEDFDKFLDPLTVVWTDSFISPPIAKAVLTDLDLGMFSSKNSTECYILITQEEYFKSYELLRYKSLKIFEAYTIKDLSSWEVWQIHNMQFPKSFRKGILGRHR